MVEQRSILIFYDYILPTPPQAAGEPEHFVHDDWLSLVTVAVAGDEVVIRIANSVIRFFPTRPLPHRGGTAIFFEWPVRSEAMRRVRSVRCRIFVYDHEGLISYADSHFCSNINHHVADTLDSLCRNLLES